MCANESIGVGRSFFLLFCGFLRNTTRNDLMEKAKKNPSNELIVKRDVIFYIKAFYFHLEKVKHLFVCICSDH